MEISIENRDNIIQLLNNGICPICNNKYANPLLHISKKHGIKPRELKNILLIKVKSSFVSPELKQIMINNTKCRDKALLISKKGNKLKYIKATKLKLIAARKNGIKGGRPKS